LNHAAVDSGIPRESATQRVGIRSQRALRKDFAATCKFAAKEAILGKPLEELVKFLAEICKIYGLRQSPDIDRDADRARLGDVVQLLDIRSDWKGSRRHTAFIRVAASYFRKKTGQWHDDWVADLANIAFPDKKGPKGGKGFTLEMVYSARRGMKPINWWSARSDFETSSPS
jgi:hypothetical protein